MEEQWRRCWKNPVLYTNNSSKITIDRPPPSSLKFRPSLHENSQTAGLLGQNGGWLVQSHANWLISIALWRITNWWVPGRQPKWFRTTTGRASLVITTKSMTFWQHPHLLSQSQVTMAMWVQLVDPNWNGPKGCHIAWVPRLLRSLFWRHTHSAPSLDWGKHAATRKCWNSYVHSGNVAFSVWEVSNKTK